LSDRFGEEFWARPNVNKHGRVPSCARKLNVCNRGTPSAIVARWNAETGKALRSSDIQDRLTAMGSTVVASDPAYFDRFLRDQAARWSKFIKEKNIAVE
jgi:tripartite-type tricarboxylate transporter receptor subunit TctC